MIVKGVGSVDRTQEEWDLRLLSPVVVFLGAITLDVGRARLNPGQNSLVVLGGVGNIHIRVPRGLPVSGSVFTVLGGQDLPGRHESGIFHGTSFDEPGAPDATSTLKISVFNLVGEIRIEHAEA